jgi:hypothetical protein
MPSLRVTIPAVLVLAAVMSAVVWKALPSDSATRATVDEAIDAFRHNADTGVAPAVGYPAPGVYSYVTRGSESFDAGLVGASHDYGGVSTVTLEAADCGLSERWQVLVERWSEARICIGAEGSSLGWLRDHHDFFGQSRVAMYRCSGPMVPPAAELRRGRRWRTACSGESGTIATTTEVLEMTKVEVAGRSIPAIHVQARAAVSGENQGVTVREEWWRRADGLLLRRDSRAEANAPGGQYEETVTLRLLALQPRR